ncbi:MAG: class I tRNA ligase family protein [Patescibacteria group bacterium]
MFRDVKNLKIPEIEEKILKFWQDNKIFEKSKSSKLKTKSFSFYDGPPFLSGKPHYGHILAATIKDTIARFQTMKGFKVERKAGWDCHGLPVENLVEQNLNFKSKKDIEKIGIDKFNAACRDYVLNCEKDFQKTLERVGRWADYSKAYFTLDNSYMESVWWVFKKLWDEKLIYKDFRVTPYCPHCGTPLSNFEVNQGYREAEDPSVYVKFPVKGEKNTYFLVWTTTPWTLPANLAIAVNPKLEYIKIKKSDFSKIPAGEKMPENEYYWVANEIFKKEYNKETGNFKGARVTPTEEIIKGAALVGKEYESLYQIPDSKSQVPNSYKVLAADFVNTEEGTGLVHLAPAFGEDDMKTGKENNLPILITVDEEGRVKQGIIGEGLFVKKADKIILEDLEKRNLLYEYRKETFKHQYPFCWRCDSPLLYYPLNAWYVAVTKIKNKLIENNKKIHWVPEHIKDGRFGKWLAEARDWAFSRNRFWGTALPIWRCHFCQKDIAAGSLKELGQLSVKSNNRYVILRHGEAESNRKKFLSCWPEKKPVKLTDKGEKQIKKAAQFLKRKNIELIFSSDLQRTKETAKIVSEKIKVPVQFDERLREYNIGEFNGQSIKKFGEFENEKINLFSKTPKEGENLDDVRKRMMSFILELEKKHKNKNILIIGHGYPLWILEGASQGLDDKDIVKTLKNYIDVGEAREIKFFNLPYSENGRLDLHRPYIDAIELNCPQCGGKAKRTSEVFDCWFESGAMPYAQRHYPFENKLLVEKTFPADFIAEGLDQTRGWFYTLHVLAAALTLKKIGLGKDQPAFKNVVVNGLILDASGSKLSKKSRNYTEPEIIINKYGADALRYFLLNSTQIGEDYQFSDKGVEEVFRKVIDKFKNVFYFYDLYGGKVQDSSLIGKLKIQNKNLLDQWVLARLNEVIGKMTAKMEAYELTEATRILADFIDDLSNWYLRRSRKRFSDFIKTGGLIAKKDFEQASAVLNYVVLETSKLMAPFAPFIAEMVYKGVKRLKSKIKSVHLEDWPTIQDSRFKIQDSRLLKDMAEIRRLASLALAKRLEAEIKVRQPLTSFSVKRQASSVKLDKELLDILKDEINVKEIIFDSEIKEEIELDTEITPELKIEGILRDLARLIQGLRQDAGYQPKNKIILMINCPEELKIILEKNGDFFKKEINARDIELRQSAKFDAELNTKLNDWLIWLGVRKI